MTTTPVVEDVTVARSWRRRVARGWAAAVGALAAAGGAVAALSAWAWLHPLILESPTWMLAATGSAVGALVLQGGQLARSGRRRATWQHALPTPYGPRPGWALGRPGLRSRHNTATAVTIAAVAALPPLAALAATGSVLAVAASSAGVALLLVLPMRALARRVRFPAGVAITPDGVATADGLAAWGAIREVEPGNRWWRHVRLTVAGRRRPLTLYGNECTVPAEELARMVEYYRADPRRVPAAEPPAGQVEGQDGGQVGGQEGQARPQTSPSSGTVPEIR